MRIQGFLRKYYRTTKVSLNKTSVKLSYLCSCSCSCSCTCSYGTPLGNDAVTRGIRIDALAIRPNWSGQGGGRKGTSASIAFLSHHLAHRGLVDQLAEHHTGSPLKTWEFILRTMYTSATAYDSDEFDDGQTSSWMPQMIAGWFHKRSLFNCTMVSHQGWLCTYRSVPGKHPLPGKHPCTPFRGVNVAASIQMYAIYMGQNRELCLSTHGRLPGTLWYVHSMFAEGLI